MSQPDCLVLVVDDDACVCEAVCDLLAAFGFDAKSFRSIAEYTAFSRPDVPSCLVLDVDLPEMSGLEFQRRAAGEEHPPIVFITAHGDVRRTVRAMKDGAVDFLTKPFADQALLDAVEDGIAADRKGRAERAALARLREQLATLTPPEREVLQVSVNGLLKELDIDEDTLPGRRLPFDAQALLAGLGRAISANVRGD